MKLKKDLSFFSRAAMTLLLMLLTTTMWAQTNHTVTLYAGEGDGDCIVISSADPANVAANQLLASNGQFWWEEDKLWFKFPNCPASFSPPDGKIFYGWNDISLAPGTIYQVEDNLELTAKWVDASFTVGYFKYRVTSESPAEVILYGRDGDYLGDIEIPETVRSSLDDKNYTVTAIGESAFFGCTGLTSITIPASVTTIGNNAFCECSDLTSVTIPASVTNIGLKAFAGCTGLTSVTIGDGVTTIDESAFAETGLTSITIPASVTTIGNNAFCQCLDLTSVTILASVTNIGSEAFAGCIGLTSVTIGDGVTTIDESAFALTGLTSITIPASVTSIGGNAFGYCSSLTTVTLNSNPTIGTNAFTDIADGAAVTMNLTANAAGGAYWMTFYNQNYDFEADANTKVFKAALTDTELELTELTTDQIVKANNAVILKSTTSPIVMTLTSTASSNDFSGNSLLGVSDAAGLTAADPSTTFVLNNGTGGVGFYRLKSGKTLGVGKAYLTYDGAFAREFFGFEETTGIKAIDNGQFLNESSGKAERTIDNEVYDLQGRRVVNPTKGLYIVNGKKVFINK